MNARLSARSPASLAVTMALVLAAGCLLLPGCKPGADQQPKPAAGGGCAPSAAAQPSKELALAGFLKSQKLEGQPVLIEFGMVGCALSDKGLDSMIALQTAGGVPGLAFVRVEANPDDAVVGPYFMAKAPAFPVYRDAQSALAKTLGATAWPTFLLVDKFGHIRYEGNYPQDNLAEWATALAAEKLDPGGNVRPFGDRPIDAEKLLAAELPDLKGNLRSLSDHQGRGGLALVFVDTSCPFSGIALKELPTVAKSLAAQKVPVLVVNNDDDAAKVREFYAKTDPGAPVVYDVGAATREKWNVRSVPIIVYITPAGQIGYHGPAVWADMGAAIETSLGLARGAIKFTATGTGFG
jgi:hypothetical protein